MLRLMLARRAVQAVTARTCAADGLQCALDWLLSRHGLPASTTARGVSAQTFHASCEANAAEPALSLAATDDPRNNDAAPEQKGGDVAIASPATERPCSPERPPALSVVLRSLAKQGDVERCFEMLNDNRDDGDVLRAYNAALKNLPPRAALRAFQLMQQQGVTPDTYTITYMVAVYASMGMLRHVDALMAQMLQCHEHLAHWSTFLAWADAHANAGNPRGVRHVMQAVESHGLEVVPHYWTLLIKASSKGAQCTQPAIDAVFEEMQRRGVAASEEVYRAAIFCHGMQGHGHRAAAAFQHMLAARVVPGMATYSALINAYAESCMPEQALGTLRAMHRAGVKSNAQTYVALMKAFSRVGDVERARAVLTTMKWEGIQPNQYAYSCLVGACVAARTPGAARRAIRDMRAAGLAPDVVTFTSLMSCYAAVGDVERTRGVLGEMRAAGVQPNMHSYTVLMQVLGDKGMPGEAQAVFEEMTREGLRPDFTASCMLVDALLNKWSRDRKGHDDLLLQAQEVFDGVGGGHLRPRVLRMPTHDTVKVDLHGHSAWTAQLAVLEVLQQLLAEYQATPRYKASMPHLQIVTGRGNRSSVSNKLAVREATLELLQPLVPVRMAAKNDGLLVVFNTHLGRLMKYMARRRCSFSPQQMRAHLVAPAP